MSNKSVADGEYFVDVATQTIPPADTWNQLSVNQLIETKNALTERYFQFQNNPVIVKTITSGLAQLEALMQQRMNAS